MNLAGNMRTITGQLVTRAHESFPADYRYELREKPSYSQSLAGRYLLRELAAGLGHADFLPEQNRYGVPLETDGYFWSVSHKENVVAAAVSKKRVGIDIEIPVRRDPAVFSLFSEREWHEIGGMDWPNFYRLWTAKEALAKKFGHGVDDIGSMTVVKCEPETIHIRWQNTMHPVHCQKHHGFFISLA